MKKNVYPSKFKRSWGFTLIELLMVIAVIGILSSIVIANLSSAREKARDARRKEDLNSIRTALELYANGNNGKYPDSLVSLIPDYFQSEPLDPLKQAYKYSNTSCDGTLTGPSVYRIMAKMESVNPNELKTCVGDSNKYYILESK